MTLRMQKKDADGSQENGTFKEFVFFCETDCKCIALVKTVSSCHGMPFAEGLSYPERTEEIQG